jgi:hypothetical protein
MTGEIPDYRRRARKNPSVFFLQKIFDLPDKNVRFGGTGPYPPGFKKTGCTSDSASLPGHRGP